MKRDCCSLEVEREDGCGMRNEKQVSNNESEQIMEMNNGEGYVTARKANFSFHIELVTSLLCMISLFLIGGCVGLGGKLYLFLIMLAIILMFLAVLSFMVGIKMWRDDYFFKEEIQLETGRNYVRYESYRLQENNLIHI